MQDRNDPGTSYLTVSGIMDRHSKKSEGSIKLFLDFALKLNEAFVTAKELNDILNAVLAGTTSGDGLGFNRAFLFLVDQKKNLLQGRFGLGPHSPEEAGRIWSEIAQGRLSLFEILDGVKDQLTDDTHPMNLLARSITVSLSDEENVLVRSLIQNQAFHVTVEPTVGALEARELCSRLGTGEFAVAPLHTHGEKYGVVVADNLYTGSTISDDLLYSLHLFTGLASLAIFQSNMYRSLEEKMAKLREVNQAVEDQKHLLVETEKFSAIGRMLDHLVHEMRNPLSAIGGLAGILKRKESDENKLKCLDTIIKEAGKIEKTLSQIVEFQEVGSMSWEMVDLTSVVDLMASTVQADLEYVGITLHKNYPADQVLVKADKEKLCQAVLYILKNSLEAMPDGGILVIGISKKGSDAELRISDSGLGIARGHFKKVDNPFFTTKFNALGLGLSKAKKIINLHKGMLSLTTNRIGGTTCIITLPRVIIPHSQ